MSKFITDEQVEAELESLRDKDTVLLAQYEQRLKYRRRQLLYSLRILDKRGQELMSQGITRESLKEQYDSIPAVCAEE